MRYFILFILLIFTYSLSFSQSKYKTSFETNNDTTLIILKVNLDGNNYRFIFDTGAQISVIFNQSNIDLSRSRTVKAIDVYGKSSDVSIIRKKITIPSIKVANKGYCLIMNNKPAFMDYLNIDGIIGADLINKYDWKIDLKKLEIIRIDKKDKPNSENLFIIPTHYENERTRVIDTYIINNGDTSSYTIDTGASLIIAAYKSDSLIKTNQTNILQSYTYNFTISSSYLEDTSYISMENIKMGNLSIEEIPFSNRRKIGTHNTIGLSFFKPFGEFYILNSNNVVLTPKVEKYQYYFPNFKIINDTIMSQYQKINEPMSPSYLGKKINESDEFKITDINVPITKYR